MDPSRKGSFCAKTPRLSSVKNLDKKRPCGGKKVAGEVVVTYMFRGKYWHVLSKKTRRGQNFSITYKFWPETYVFYHR